MSILTKGRENQRGHFSQRRTDGCEDVHVIPHNLSGSHRPDTLGRPTRSMLIYATKTAFILRCEDYGSGVLWISLCDYSFYLLGEFFLNSSCTSLFASI